MIDPKLAPLSDNGGPTLADGSRLQTHALLPGSPAIDAGNPSAVAGVGGVPEFDERGFARVVDGDDVGGSRIDIGAVEQRTLHLLVDTLADEDDGNYSVGDLSLREAIRLTNNNLGGSDTIAFAPVLAGGTILLTQGELVIADSVIITGLGAGMLRVDASGNDPTPSTNNGDGSRVFNISGATNVAMSGLTITGGDSASSGGGISAGACNLTVTDSTITGNSSGEARWRHLQPQW